MTGAGGAGTGSEDRPPRRANPPRADDRGRHLGGPVHLSEALGAVSDRLGGPRPDVLTALFGRWEHIVGDAMAAHVRPLRLHEGTLVVACDHPAWATQVRHLAADILDRVREACGEGGAPERIEARVRH